jgi:hypothetical protein
MVASMIDRVIRPRCGTTAGAEGVWGFEVVGSAAALVDEAEKPAEQWAPRLLSLPRTLADEAGKGGGAQEVDWGVSALYEETEGPGPGMIYIYGLEMAGAGQRDLLLARASPVAFEDFPRWEFYAEGKWMASPAQAQAVVHDVASELSIDRLALPSGSVQYLMVSSEPNLGDRIFLRSATAPEGPWSAPTPVYQITAVQGSKTLFTYAAKGHGPLSEPGTLLISYVINSHDFGELVNNAWLYRPLFIRLPLAAFTRD